MPDVLGRRWAGAALLASIGCILAPAAIGQDAKPPVLSVALRNTLDGWIVVDGARREPVVLDKLQASGTLALDRLGLEGVDVHAQIFHIGGANLSARIGDVQTADAIDALPATRIFEA